MARKKFPDEVRARKRDDILDVAMSVFEADGLEALSFRRLADGMDLSHSAPYRYFASKEELVNALRARAYRWIEREMLDAIDGISGPEQQLEAVAAAYIRSGLERPHRYALMFFNLNDVDTLRDFPELAAAKRDALDVCTRVIAAGQQSGDFPRTLDPLTVAHLFWIGAHGVVSLQVAGQFVMGRTVQQLVPTLIHTLRMGMEHFKQTARPKARAKAAGAKEKRRG
ncbi:transcriptional regulator, TetR family [Solimonas aquatica]|uniref:Transcriptional regulator, TetR family n=1 Tax=Solimonas aquatica TaxID=489703 RepID=A0A1H9GHE8_9GAMM|nr:TetR/AcrR family transcriptional regulator [Solimonas aquatica]SEQ49486.1 transcriptional regulator, TetR family [Solimonas aquatica]